MSYYFSPRAPSIYIGGGIGLGALGDLENSSVASYTGSGASLTTGYEFVPHFSVEVNLSSSNVENQDDSSDSIDVLAGRLLLKWVLY